VETINRPSNRQADVIGKPFLVLASHLRLCLVCDQTFSSQQARIHASLSCWPAKIVPNSSLGRLGGVIQ